MFRLPPGWGLHILPDRPIVRCHAECRRDRRLLLARVTLFAGGALAMVRGRGVLCMGLCGYRFALGCVFGLDFRGRMLLMSSVAHGCGSVGFVRALCGLLFFFFLFGRF